MLYTAFKNWGSVFLLAAAAVSAQAQTAAPRVVVEPLFGLRVDVKKTQLELLPERARGQCMELADTDHLTARMWIVASAGNGKATYYVVSGYFQRKLPKRGERKFRLDDRGGIYRIENERCIGVGAVHEVFDAGPTDEVPLPMLQQLAKGMATTLRRAAGGSVALKRKLDRKQIELTSLSPELRKAFESP